MSKPVKKKTALETNDSQAENGTRLTTPDLVILSLLAERPMHGYEVNSTLEDRKIRDWAAVSRPQIYYSLDKLTRLGLIRITTDDSASAGPERRVFETTGPGLNRLSDALESSRWSTTSVHQPFLTWLALSWQARPPSFQRQLRARQKFLKAQLVEGQATLRDVLAEVGHAHHEAVWMLTLLIEQTQTELKWLGRVLNQAAKRAPAKHPKVSLD
jgi:DNA-binding PadR family transcriptional regulator